MSNAKTPTGKLPPQNTEAEAGLLGSVLIDQEIMNEIADKLDDDDFYEQRHGDIYGAMKQLFSKRQPIDLLTIADILRNEQKLDAIGGSSYLTELTNKVPTAAHGEHYAEIVSQKSVRRKVIKASQEIVNLGYDEEKTTREILENAEARLFEVSQKEVSNDLTPIENILSASFDRLDELARDKSSVSGVPTGYRDLDKKLAGLHKSDLIILAARPAMGKSTLAMNIAHNIALKSKAPVLVFSLEMSKEQLVDRLLAAEAGIDSWNLRTGNLTDNDFEKLGRAMGSLSEAPILIDDTPGISVSEMRTKARRENHKAPIGLIVIDYLQLMTSNARNSDNRVQEISEISRGLKEIARELSVPIIALSQLSRSVESRTPQIPQLSDLRESGSIEQDADIVMFIYREAYYNEDTDRQNITDVLIQKHRNGPTGRVELYFHPEQLRFMTLDKQHSEQPE